MRLAPISEDAEIDEMRYYVIISRCTINYMSLRASADRLSVLPRI
jgi:hypothetical protein